MSIGNGNDKYTFKRNNGTGAMEIIGTQATYSSFLFGTDVVPTALKIENNGDVNPGTNNSQSFGSYGFAWENIYASSTAYLSFVSSTMIEPLTNNVGKLGSFGKAWGSLYVSSSAYLSFVSTTMIEPFTNNVSPLGSFGKAWSNLFASGTAYLANVTISDTLTLASSTNPTINATGEIGINTTNASSSVRYHDGTAERALYDVQYKTISIVSSTLDAYEGKTASSTIPLGVASPHGETWTELICFTDAGTAEIEFGDGTNWMDYYKATTATTTRDTSLTNGAFTDLEKRYVRVGKLVTADTITCSVGIREAAD